MLRARREIRLNVPPLVDWAWLSQLDQLATVNLFHQRVRFIGPDRAGTGTLLSMQHGLRVLGRVPISMERQARVTHWEVGRALGWVEIDPASPKSRFPHSQLFVLESQPGLADQTRLVNELGGSLNLPWPRLGGWVDRLFGRWWVGWILERENLTLKRRIEAWQRAEPHPTK